MNFMQMFSAKPLLSFFNICHRLSTHEQKKRCLTALIPLLFLVISACGQSPENPAGGGSVITNCTDLALDEKTSRRNATISGTVKFEDGSQSILGFEGQIFTKPARYIEVDVVRCSDLAVLETGQTDSAGRFSISFLNNGFAGVYLRALAKINANPESETGPFQDVLVYNNVSQHELHAVPLYAFDETSGDAFTTNAVIPANPKNNMPGLGGLFNMLDLTISASAFIKKYETRPVPPIVILWEGSSIGTFYSGDKTGGMIFVKGEAADRDDYDDDVFLHEYGHFLTTSFSRDSSPGGEHFLVDSKVDIRLAWSEGWASFLAAAMKNYSIIVDTTKTAVYTFDLESSSCSIPTCNARAIYSTNELAVSSILWDMYDNSTKERFDTISLGFQPIWNIATTYFTGENAGLISLETMNDAISDTMPEIYPQFIELSKTRTIEFFEDEYEDDDTYELASPINTNGAFYHHTLFNADRTSDTDIHKLTVYQGVTYRIWTSELTNGADTMIRITTSNPDDVLQTSDNITGIGYEGCGSGRNGQVDCPKNDKITLSSQITYTAAENTEIYIVISRPGTAPPSAGRYGSYDISVLQK